MMMLHDERGHSVTWHVGSIPLYTRDQLQGNVLTVTVDGDELEWLLSQIGVRRVNSTDNPSSPDSKKTESKAE